MWNCWVKGHVKLKLLWTVPHWFIERWRLFILSPTLYKRPFFLHLHQYWVNIALYFADPLSQKWYCIVLMYTSVFINETAYFLLPTLRKLSSICVLCLLGWVAFKWWPTGLSVGNACQRWPLDHCIPLCIRTLKAWENWFPPLVRLSVLRSCHSMCQLPCLWSQVKDGESREGLKSSS